MPTFQEELDSILLPGEEQVFAEPNVTIGGADDEKSASLYSENKDSEWKAAGLGVLSSLSFGTSNYIMTKFGLVDRETLEAIRKYNPTSYAVGEVVTDVATILLSGGLGGIAKGGTKAVGKFGLKKALGTASKYTPTGLIDNLARKNADDLFKWANKTVNKGRIGPQTAFKSGATKSLKLGTEASIDSAIFGIRDAVTDLSLDDRQHTIGEFVERSFTYAKDNAVGGFIFGTGLGAAGYLVKGLGPKIGNKIKSDISQRGIFDSINPPKDAGLNGNAQQIAAVRAARDNQFDMFKVTLERELKDANYNTDIIDDLLQDKDKLKKALDKTASDGTLNLEKFVKEEANDVVGVTRTSVLDYRENNILKPLEVQYADPAFLKENSFLAKQRKVLINERTKIHTSPKEKVAPSTVAVDDTNVGNVGAEPLDDVTQVFEDTIGNTIKKPTSNEIAQSMPIDEMLKQKRLWQDKAQYWRKDLNVTTAEVEFARDMTRGYDEMIKKSLLESGIDGQELMQKYADLNANISSVLEFRSNVSLKAINKPGGIEKVLKNFTKSGMSAVAWRLGLGYVAGPAISAGVEFGSVAIGKTVRQRKLREAVLEGIDKGEAQAQKMKDSAIKNFFKKNAGDIEKIVELGKSRTIKSSLATYGSGDRAENYTKFRDDLGDVIAKTDELVDNTAGASSMVSTVFPELGDAMAAKSTEVALFLQQRLIPESITGDIMGNNKVPYSDMELDKFDRYMTALDPRRIYVSLAKNLLSIEEAEVLRKIYPSILADIVDGLLEYVVTKKPKLDPNQKLTFSTLMGLPYEQTMRPQAVQQFQGTWMPQEEGSGQHGGSRPQNYAASGDKQSQSKTQALEAKASEA